MACQLAFPVWLFKSLWQYCEQEAKYHDRSLKLC